MRVTRGGWVLGSGAVLALLAVGCSDGGSFVRYCDDTGCYACPPGESCYPDNLPPCTSDASCDAGSVCTTMGCAPRCTSDDDCREGEYCCEYGYCAPREGDLPTPVSEPCSEGSCADGQRCDADSGQCVAACQSDGDCGDGQVCDASTGQCVEGQAPPEELACKTTAECPAGLECRGGCCHPPVEPTAYCQDTAECGEGRTCLDSECHANCEDSSSCPTGQICQEGACIDDPAPANPECVFDVDCGGAQTCINGYCHDLCEEGAACGSGESCQAGVCRADYRAAAR